MRTFLALPVPESWITPLARVQAHLRGGRKVDLDDLHLTLAFLDDQPEDRLQALHEELEARALFPAELMPTAYGVIGGGKPRAVVLDIAPTPALTALRENVRRAVRAAGIDLPRERFRPHVTLARYPASAPGDDRLPERLARLGPPEMVPDMAGPVTLWSSVLTPQGPIYEVLSAYPGVPA
ncbi:RNA 2',3'-cyclic phosphodiesterase [Jannaschia seohaensis]|uniref:RNA 2',3'-cyclic phosphodiesterase n=1 Tax=Jannaschia seohaensis TaxID=475081 RepID=A0A2Y9B068_9RHOB|nr:RNA 2',3'-cyclic phosphodiesterase [Jannaschia seohaensis]PWJ15051.1 2'-5' RNA ligase [Jannaschia seohaensis]SSA49900.1 2'-5' RNA ligase [Jannaschia seohaensis]